MPEVLAAKQVSKQYQLGTERIDALRQVSLSIAEGTFVAVMGPSGSGKSTLLNMLGLLDTPDSGEVWLSQHNTHQHNDDTLTRLRRDRIGFIFQTFELIPTLTAEENILLSADLAGRLSQAKERLVVLAQRLGLQGRLKNRPSELSGGQRQRVAIARALVSQPAVILADEPTGNLDSKNGKEVLEIFRRGVDEEGWTVVMVTHDPLSALMADRIIFLRDGEVVGETLAKDGQARAQIEAFVGV